MIATYRPLFRLLREHRRRIALIAVFSAGTTAGIVILPILIGGAVDRIQQEDKPGLYLIVGLIALCGAMTAGLWAAKGIVSGHLSLVVERDLRERLYLQWQRLDLAELDEHPSAQYLSMTIADLIPLTGFLGIGLGALIQAVLTVVFSAVVMLFLQLPLALVALAPLPVALWLLIRYRIRAVPVQVAVRERTAEVAGDLEETLTGMAVVKGYAREDDRLEQYRATTARLVEEKERSAKLSALYSGAVMNLPIVGLAAVVIIGARVAIQGDLSVVAFSVFFTYLVMLVPSVGQIGTWVGIGYAALAIASRLEGALAHEPTIRSAAGAQALPDGGGALALEHVKVARAGEAALLEDVDAAVPAGGRIAIVGASGSGKSTLLTLVNRLYEADGGAVRVDGLAVREVDLRALRGQVAAATDDAFLFSATVRENIAYARPDAGAAEVEEAARLANADEFIAELPDGYDTQLGNRGVMLSGGQRERIAIARAVLASPRILLLDNATGALDTRTEAEVLDAIERELDGRTTVLIAYRESSTRLADEVLVLEAGRVVERGTHDELAARSQRYRTLMGLDREGAL